MLRTSLAIIFVFVICFVMISNASQQNRTSHHIRRSSVDDSFFSKNKKSASYRSFQPVAIKYHKPTYPRADDRPEYPSYDADYGGVVSNFTSSIYDDNPPLYPNPEYISRSNQVPNKPQDTKMNEAEELPEDSLADADLKEHDIIDSVTYLYGFNNCHEVRNEWMILIFITSGIAIILLFGAMVWLIWSDFASEFRRCSKLYPININLCCCLAACTLIYVQAIMGVSSPSQCERIALLLHYTHISCSLWILALAMAVAEYCSSNTIIPLKYNYLLAYGVPAVVVMFNYAMSMEQYETKHYCWMSIEKGMVMGFMVPAMALIVINTAVVILGLQSVNKRQADVLTAKIQEFLDHHITGIPKNEEENKGGSIETLDNIYTPGSSRKNTDSSETLDKEYNFSDDDCPYVNPEIVHDATHTRIISDKGLFNMLFTDNLSLRWSWNVEGNELKTYLNLCLVLEPFFAVNWVMGVVAIENAAHWSTPTIYLILVVAMYVYFTVTICTTLPIVHNNNTSVTCEDIVIDPGMPRSRTTDSIPLLDPAVQQPTVTPAPADSISTISI